MNNQINILFFLIFFTIVTIFLYIWKAKKDINYKKDERWIFIQKKANNITNYLQYILIFALAIGQFIILFTDLEITFSLNNILTYSLLLLGLRNTIELFALKYFDKKI